MRLSFTSLALAALGLSSPAAAQSLLPSGTGFAVAGQVAAESFSLDGAGFAGGATRVNGRVELAYGATARLSVLAALRPLAAKTTASVNGLPLPSNYTVNSVEIGVRYLGYAGQQFRPFAEGGFAVRRLRYERVDAFTADKVAPWAGVGVMRLAPGHWALEAAATWTAADFDSWKRNGTGIVVDGTAKWRGIGARAGVRYWVRAR